MTLDDYVSSVRTKEIKKELLNGLNLFINAGQLAGIECDDLAGQIGWRPQNSFYKLF